MVVKVWVRKRKIVNGILLEVCGYGEGNTSEEASRKAHQLADKILEEKEKEIGKVQKECNHEFEPVWSEIHKCYYLKCKKCGYTDYIRTNPFDTTFFKAYQARLIKIPHNL